MKLEDTSWSLKSMESIYDRYMTVPHEIHLSAIGASAAPSR